MSSSHSKRHPTFAEKFNIQAASRLSGLSEHTLRAWERRYRTIQPHRSPNGRRTYSIDEIEKLKLLARLVDQGHSIGSIAHLSISRLREILGQPAEKEAEPPQAAIPPSAALHATLAAPILASIADFRIDRMDQSLSIARSQLSAREFVLQIASPVLEAVGEQVSRGNWSVAQEHAFSAILRDYLGQTLRPLIASMYERTLQLPSERRGVFACAEGDLHEFGILLAAILFAVNQYGVFYLGPNLPAADLVVAMKRFEAGIAVLGATPGPKPINSYLCELDALAPDGAQFWVGGPEIDLHQPLPVRHGWVHLKNLQELDRLLLRSS